MKIVVEVQGFVDDKLVLPTESFLGRVVCKDDEVVTRVLFLCGTRVVVDGHRDHQRVLQFVVEWGVLLVKHQPIGERTCPPLIGTGALQEIRFGDQHFGCPRLGKVLLGSENEREHGQSNQGIHNVVANV